MLVADCWLLVRNEKKSLNATVSLSNQLYYTLRNCEILSVWIWHIFVMFTISSTFKLYISGSQRVSYEGEDVLYT